MIRDVPGIVLNVSKSYKRNPAPAGSLAGGEMAKMATAKQRESGPSARQATALPSRRRRVNLPCVRNSYTSKPASPAKAGEQRNASQGSAVPRQRTEIKAKDARDLPERFALHLRKIMADREWSSKDVAERISAAGVPIGARGVDVWLRGEGSPKFKDLEKIGRALGLRDYRELLPPPVGMGGK